MYGRVNYLNGLFASWTFRQAEKFFDVVTWTGNGSGSRAISHNLGSTPGCIILKRTDTADDWYVVHRGATDFSYYGVLNSTAAFAGPDASGISSVNSTSFTVSSYYNGSGATWVAYLFAHDAGGFGNSGTDNVITCGSYTGNGTTTGPTVNLGYEPQWILVKRATVSTGQWEIYDSMRGMTVGGNEAILRPNSSDAEFSTVNRITPTATGFFASDSDGDVNANGSVYIYIAIRRGPMKTPTTGTSVFSPVVQLADQFVTTNFPVDSMWSVWTTLAGYGSNVADRLRGGGNYLNTRSTAAEDVNATQYIKFDYNNGVDESLFNPSFQRIYWNFRRAPGFFDVVCYTGNGSASGQVINHNLGVTPELIIIKSRSGAYQWHVYAASLGQNKALFLESTSAEQTNGALNGGTINSTQFELKVDFNNVNGSGQTYVAYLFATLAGVSKVGSYTGTGTTLQVNCGFTGGARFVLIKRTDSTGDWYVWDSARGIVAGNDPYVLLNNDAAEVTNTDYVDTYSAGFEISSTAPAAINANGGTYIFLAIA